LVGRFLLFGDVSYQSLSFFFERIDDVVDIIDVIDTLWASRLLW